MQGRIQSVQQKRAEYIGTVIFCDHEDLVCLPKIQLLEFFQVGGFQALFHAAIGKRQFPECFFIVIQNSHAATLCIQCIGQQGAKAAAADDKHALVFFMNMKHDFPSFLVLVCYGFYRRPEESL